MLSSATHKEYESLFIPLNLECFRTGGKKPVDSEVESPFTDDAPLVKTKVIGIAEPYILALIGVSGISQPQAKTCFYFAVATHLLPEQLQLMPILAIIGALGPGKSKFMTQLGKMVKQPKLIGAESQSTLRDELDGTVTALLDEGDKEYNTLPRASPRWAASSYWHALHSKMGITGAVS